VKPARNCSDAHDFASALKNALRQDPDVILVGEMRDIDTMQTAIYSAKQTLVCTTHDDAPSALGALLILYSGGQQFVDCPTCVGCCMGVVCQFASCRYPASRHKNDVRILSQRVLER